MGVLYYTEKIELFNCINLFGMCKFLTGNLGVPNEIFGIDIWKDKWFEFINIAGKQFKLRVYFLGHLEKHLNLHNYNTKYIEFGIMYIGVK